MKQITNPPKGKFIEPPTKEQLKIIWNSIKDELNTLILSQDYQSIENLIDDIEQKKEMREILVSNEIIECIGRSMPISKPELIGSLISTYIKYDAKDEIEQILQGSIASINQISATYLSIVCPEINHIISEIPKFTNINIEIFKEIKTNVSSKLRPKLKDEGYSKSLLADKICNELILDLIEKPDLLQKITSIPTEYEIYCGIFMPDFSRSQSLDKNLFKTAIQEIIKTAKPKTFSIKNPEFQPLNSNEKQNRGI